MRPLATFSFFIFQQLFNFLTLLVTPSSSSLFFPRPALSESFRIRKRPFFSDFDESITNRPTNRPTDQPTDKASYRDADASKILPPRMENASSISGRCSLQKTSFDAITHHSSGSLLKVKDVFLCTDATRALLMIPPRLLFELAGDNHCVTTTVTKV